MVVQPSTAAVGDPPDPPLFGSFRPNNHRTFPRVSKPTATGQNPTSTVSSSSTQMAAPPPDSDFRRQPGPMARKRSYAQVVKPDGMKTNINPDLHLFGTVKPHTGIQSSVRDGVKVVSISDEVNRVLSEPFKWALVGKFSHGTPKTYQIGKFFDSLNLIGKFQLLWLSPRQIMVILGDETDFVRVWLGKIWQVGGVPMRLIKWTTSFDPKVESPIVPVWVRLPGLPAQFFDRGILFEIAKNLGKPIRVDTATAFRTKISEARVCIELDLLLPRSDFIIIDYDGQSRKQRVVFENIPVFCSFCSHVGHGEDVCFRAHENLKSTALFKVIKPSLAVAQSGVGNDHSRAMSVVQKCVSNLLVPSQSLVLKMVIGNDLPLLKFPLLGLFNCFNPFLFVGAGLKRQASSSIWSLSEIEEGEIVELVLQPAVDENFKKLMFVAGAKPSHACVYGVNHLHAVDTSVECDVQSQQLVVHDGTESCLDFNVGSNRLVVGANLIDSMEDDVVAESEFVDIDTINGVCVEDESSFFSTVKSSDVAGVASIYVPAVPHTEPHVAHRSGLQDDLFVNENVMALNAEDKEKTETGLDPVPISFNSLNVVVMESVAGDKAVNPYLAIQDMVLSGFSESSLDMHGPVHAVMEEDGLGSSFLDGEPAAVVGGEELLRSDVTVKVELDDIQHVAAVGGKEVMRADVCEVEIDLRLQGQDSTIGVSEIFLPLHATVHAHNSPAVVVSGEEDPPAVSEVVVAEEVGLDPVDEADGSGFCFGPSSHSFGPEVVTMAGPVRYSNGPSAFPKEHGPIPIEKINETVKTSNPFRLFKDKRQMDKMDGILKSGFLRKPVRNVQGNKPCGESKATKTPLQLAQEELSKGGAFHDFVITDSHTSKPFSNMDFMARMNWADEMEDDVD